MLQTGRGTLDDDIDYNFNVESENIETYLDREPFFKWARENPFNLTEPIKNALISNLVHLKRVGLVYLKTLIEGMGEGDREELLTKFEEDLENPVNRPPASYELLQQIGYTGIVKRGYPISSALGVRMEVMLDNRGLNMNNGKIVGFNANIFARYVLKRMKLIQFIDGSLYIYDRRGYYVKVNEGFLKKVCRNILHEAKDNIWNRKWEKEYYEALIREISQISRLNAYPEYINVKNGMLNIYTQELKEHDPKYLSTIQIPVQYNRDKECPMFIDFLLDIFEKDMERVKLVQEILGYSFLHDIKIQKAFIFYGYGSNGKSVLAAIFRALIGPENVSSVPLNELNSRFGMQSLPGKLLNISTENEFSKKFNTQNLKAITGGDAVNIEQKYKDSYSSVLYAKLIILVNRMMDVDDYSNGFYRRLEIIPFNRVYKEKKAGTEGIEGTSYMDKDLIDKLLNELDGILNFALEGLRRLIENNFNMTPSKACELALEEYKKKQIPIIEFFKDCVIVDSRACTSRPDFKKEFSVWAINNGYEDWANVGATKFWDLFRTILQDNDVEINEKKVNGEVFIEGLSLLTKENGNYSEFVLPCIKN